jgi:HEAT repeat protein
MSLSTKLIIFLAVLWILVVGPGPCWSQTTPPPAAEPMAHGKPLKYWMGALQDPEVVVREEAILVLGDLGPAARDTVPDLTKLLKDARMPVRLKAAAALVRIDRQQAKVAVPVLCEGLKNGSLQDRLQTVQVLGQIGPEGNDAVVPLLEVLIDAEPNLRNLAGMSLTQIGVAAVPALKDTLGHKDASMRQAAAEALGRLGPRAKDATPALKERLKDDDVLTRVRSAQALWQIERQDDVAIRALGDAMKNKDVTVRRAASLVLVQMEHRPKEALPILTAGMKDDDPLTRVQCAQAVWDTNRKTDEVMPVFVAVLKNPKDHPPALGATLAALNRLGPEAKAAVSPLVEILKTPNFNFYVYNVPDTLSAIGAAAVPALTDLLENKETPPNLLPSIIQALARAGPDGAPELVKALSHDNQMVRAQALGQLGQMGPAGKAAVPKLAELAKGGEANVRLQALSALWQIGPDARPAVPALVENLKDPNAAVVNQTLLALRYIQPDPKTVIPALQDLLKSNNAVQRATAADLIITLDPTNKTVLPLLIELLGDKQVGVMAVGSLRRLGPDAKEAVPELVKLLKAPPNPYGRNQVLLTLAQIGPDAKDAIPDVLDVLKTDKDIGNRNAALLALKAMKAASPENLAAVIAVVEEKGLPSWPQYTALDLLGEWGKESKEATAALLEALINSNPQCRLYAADALLKVDPDLARKKAPPLLEKLLSQLPPIRAQAATALIRLDPDNRAAWDSVRETLRDPGESSRMAMIDALGQMGADARKALPDIREALKDSSPVVRNRAALALWLIDKDTKDEALAVLLAVLKKEVGFQRMGAVNALAAMGADAKKALPDLLEARSDRDYGVRNASTEAVKKIDPDGFARIGVPEKK